jgi:hypothetical protein
MSEKRGNTGKMVYDFNSAACLEVQLPNKNWYRITPREFRSYTYPRRILVNGEYQIYDGPVYLYETNIVVKNPTKQGLLYVNDIDPRTLVKSTRQHGRL